MDIIELRLLQGGQPVRVTRVRCEKADVWEEDGHAPPLPLAALTLEEQAFVLAFLRSHGNIREMERLFNISYPTVKKRLNALVEKLDDQFQAPLEDAQGEVLRRLGDGKITAEEALAELDRLGGHRRAQEVRK